MRFGQRLRSPLGLGFRLPALDQRARDLRCDAVHALAVERVAAEHVDLLELREEARAGIAAGGALHFGNGQVLGDRQLIGEEVVAIEVPRDDQHVATDLLLACSRKPVGPAPLDELDELVILVGKVTTKRFAFVRRVDSDRAHRPPGVRGGHTEGCDGAKDRDGMAEHVREVRARMRALDRECTGCTNYPVALASAQPAGLHMRVSPRRREL
jgi:hypothetical protein